MREPLSTILIITFTLMTLGATRASFLLKNFKNIP